MSSKRPNRKVRKGKYTKYLSSVQIYTTKTITMRIKDEIMYILWVIIAHVCAACSTHHMMTLLVFGEKGFCKALAWSE